MNDALWWALLLVMFLREKQGNIRKKSEENLQKWRFPAYFRHFRPKKNFSKIGLSHIMGIANTHLCAKNQNKQRTERTYLMMKVR